MDRDIERRFEEVDDRFEHLHEWKRKIEGDLNGSGFEKQGIFSKLKGLEKECEKTQKLFTMYGDIKLKAEKAHSRIDEMEKDEDQEEKKSSRLWERLGIVAAVLGVIWALVRG